MDTSPKSLDRTSAAAGSACLFLGFLLAVVVLTVRLEADWGHLGSVIGRNPVLCWGASVILMLGGAALIKQASYRDPIWHPEIPGRRFHRAVLYTRDACPLCDEALRTLNPYLRYLPKLEIINVGKDASLQSKHGKCVPVLELDDRVRFRGHISEALLQRLIDGSPPVQDR